MKKVIIVILLASPCIVFSQSMHLPGARLPALKRNPSDSSQNLKGNKAEFDDISLNLDGTSKGTANSPISYNAQVLSTNFTIPLVRVNFLNNKPTNSTNSIVSTSFLTSAGAGLNYSWGVLDQTLDANGNSASVDYHSHFGIQLGFLFAANSSSGTSTATNATNTNTQSSNIFALVGGFSILNFQVGAGYELGSLTVGQRRGFLTIAYAIPMAALLDGGYKIIKMSPIQK